METATQTEGPLVLRLHEREAQRPELVGGKGASLARLLAAGFPVPGGFCVTTAAYRQLLGHNSIRTRELPEQAEGVRERLGGASLPTELRQSIRSAYGELAGNGGAVAVRSSSLLEDMPGASFAGQHETVLGVEGEDALLGALRSCWASLYSAPALAYRSSQGVERADAAMAVVVQSMVDAEVSGVVFTRDPVSGDDVVVVDASWGLGEAVVSGWVTPDRYRLSRDGELLDSKIAAKRERAAPASPSASPGEREPVPDHLALQPCLADRTLAELAQLALGVENEAGSPQDMEFALADGRLWLLQSRPITAVADRAAERPDLEPLLAPGMRRWPGDQWTRVIGDEYWADPVTPFTFGSLGIWIDRDTTKAVDRLMGFDQIDPGRPTLRLHRSHAYWNADTAAAGFKFIPRVARNETLLAYLPPGTREEVANTPTAWLARLRGELLMRLRDRDGTARRNHRALAGHAQRVASACARLDRIDLDRAAQDEVDRYWDLVDGLGQAHFEIIRWGLSQHSLTFNFALAKLLADWLDDDGQLFGALIGSTERSLTLETNREVWRLAQLARDDAAAHELVEQAGMPVVAVGGNPANPNFEALARADGEGRLAGELRSFLERFGHRAFSRELGLPRWIDQPDAVIGLIAGALDAADDPQQRAERERAKRVAIERELRRRLGSGVRGRVRRAILDVVVRYARIYTAFRENQRFTLDHVFLRARRAALAYGRLLGEAGLADDPGDVFFLTRHEVRSALRGELGDPPGLIRARREAFERDSQSLPPTYLRGDEVLAIETEGADGAVLTGMPVSAGRVVARCCVVHGLEDAGRLEAGDVLVAPNTDPGWTPLFMKLGGVVLETGGALAHGAIVAREYGIPAVTAVANATRRIRDGEWVTLDGRAGTVQCHGEQPDRTESPQPTETPTETNTQEAKR